MYNENDIQKIADKTVWDEKSVLASCKIPKAPEALYLEITEALARKNQEFVNLMIKYCELMQKAQRMYNPCATYQYGRKQCK